MNGSANLLICLVTFTIFALPGESVTAVAGEPQYLLFQIFVGAPDQRTGKFVQMAQKSGYEEAADRILKAIGPTADGTDRYVGISIGPILMDQSKDEMRAIVRDLFDVAASKNVAVALHLDDYMFWENAKDAKGRLLRDNPGNVEWKDWQGTPAEPLQIGWIPNAKLAPQMCYESPEIQEFVTHWFRDVVGDEVRQQLDRLQREGKAHLFAGIITGWETNLAYGYNSFTRLGYSAEKPPADFDRQRERILQRHIARVAKCFRDARIPRDLVYSHIAPIPRADYDRIASVKSPEEIRQIHQSTVFRAHWTAFNEYGNPGFGGYVGGSRFDDIYQALEKHGNPPWAMAEGTNVMLTAGTHTGGAAPSPVNWETYLAMNFNHEARIVNLFGGFMETGAGLFGTATESTEAIAAYKKFARGEPLTEVVTKKSAAVNSNSTFPIWMIVFGNVIVLLSVVTMLRGRARRPISVCLTLGIVGACIAIGGYVLRNGQHAKNESEHELSSSRTPVTSKPTSVMPETDTPASPTPTSSATSPTANPAASSAEPIGPKAVQDRLIALQKRVEDFARSGGDMSKIKPKMDALGDMMQTGDIHKVSAHADEIERLLQ